MLCSRINEIPALYYNVIRGHILKEDMYAVVLYKYINKI